ncbi:hypothetical protein DY023_11295 [Microbacterium bovistercoris]|uniref:Uncharacterized protein n=2 Tax=Microbacterium bovistercoris TaxID=2293570 RepID=A0A371NSG4_9MICO|nr:hypothetical protein DY023_11295 [Microbacterium bovistercoris]
MVLCDGQLVAGMKRSVDARRVVFDIVPHRLLTTREKREIQQAARRYAAHLGVEPEVVYAEP